MDLGILGESSLTDSLLGQGKLLQGGGKWLITSASVLLMQELAAGQGGAGDGVGKRLGLGLRRRRGGQGGLGLGGRRGRREEGDLLTDGATEVVESLADVGGVVVGFLRVLVTDKG